MKKRKKRKKKSSKKRMKTTIIRSPRMMIPIRMDYKIIKTKSDWKEIVCSNISGTGVQLYVEEPFMENEKVDLAIYPKKDGNPIHLTCKVAWCRHEKGGRFRTGLEFIKVKDPIGFNEFMCEQIIKISLDGKDVITG